MAKYCTLHVCIYYILNAVSHCKFYSTESIRIHMYTCRFSACSSNWHAGCIYCHMRNDILVQIYNNICASPDSFACCRISVYGPAIKWNMQLVERHAGTCWPSVADAFLKLLMILCTVQRSFPAKTVHMIETPVQGRPIPPPNLTRSLTLCAD